MQYIYICACIYIYIYHPYKEKIKTKMKPNPLLVVLISTFEGQSFAPHHLSLLKGVFLQPGSLQTSTRVAVCGRKAGADETVAWPCELLDKFNILVLKLKTFSRAF